LLFTIIFFVDSCLFFFGRSGVPHISRMNRIKSMLSLR